MPEELCPICGGVMEERRVRVFHDRGSDLLPIIVNGVQASVCQQCGHRWFSLAVMRELEKLYRGERTPTERQEVAVYRLT